VPSKRCWPRGFCRPSKTLTRLPRAPRGSRVNDKMLPPLKMTSTRLDDLVSPLSCTATIFPFLSWEKAGALTLDTLGSTLRLFGMPWARAVIENRKAVTGREHSQSVMPIPLFRLPALTPLLYESTRDVPPRYPEKRSKSWMITCYTLLRPP